MGALRAAELHSHGMIGVGKIFEAYRDGQVLADDEVALTYDPVSYRSLSEPLINMRFTLHRAVERNLLSTGRAEEVLRQLANFWFPERCYVLLLQLCPELKPHLDEIRQDQKAEDAISLLRAIHALVKGKLTGTAEVGQRF